MNLEDSISRQVQKLDLYEDPLLVTRAPEYFSYLFRQKETNTLCLILISDVGEAITQFMVEEHPITEMRDWFGIAVDRYWYIYGVLPEQTNNIKIVANDTTNLTFSTIHKCFLLTSNSLPFSIEFEDSSLQTVKEIKFHNFLDTDFPNYNSLRSRLESFIFQIRSKNSPGEPVQMQRLNLPKWLDKLLGE